MLGDVFEPLPSSLAGGKEGQSKGVGEDKHDGGLSFDTGQLVAKRSVVLVLSVLFCVFCSCWCFVGQ